jgi:hypothetical protein
MMFYLQEIQKSKDWLRKHMTICEKLWARRGFRGIGELL